MQYNVFGFHSIIELLARRLKFLDYQAYKTAESERRIPILFGIYNRIGGRRSLSPVYKLGNKYILCNYVIEGCGFSCRCAFCW